MKILIINITILWVYRLYEEYILSIKDFIINNYNNIEVNILTYDEKIFNEDKNIKKKLINNIFFNNNDKIFYSGNFDIYNFLVLNYFNTNTNTNSNANTDTAIIQNNKFFYINIEQMSKSSYYILLLKNLNLNSSINHNIIDYSEENIPFLNKNYNTFMFPPFFRFKAIKIEDKNIELLSISNNEYRETILSSINRELNKTKNKESKNNDENNEIQEKEKNILFIKDVFGKKRDDYFYKTKIYINIHCSEEHNTMELIRILNLISNKVIVITQKSIYTDLLFIKDKIIICNDVANFSEYIYEILNNYEYYFNKFFNDIDEDYYKEYIKSNLDKIINY